MPVRLENVQITSYQLGVLDNNASTNGDDSFVFQPQALPGDTDGRDFLVWQRQYSEPASESDFSYGSEPQVMVDLPVYAPTDDWGLV